MNGFKGRKTGLFKPVSEADLLVDQTCPADSKRVWGK